MVSHDASGGGRVAEDARELTASRRHAADAPAIVASNADAGDLRAFRTMVAPAVFSNVGACHMVSLQAVASGTHANSGNDAGLEVCSYEIPESFARAVPSRVRSFLAGRHCAGRALELTGRPAPGQPLPIGNWGAPSWPVGIIGSITHSSQLAAAVAIPDSRVRSVGIDAELVMSSASVLEVESRVMPEAEDMRGSLEIVGVLSWNEFVTAVFSAKESIYKCLHPICGIFFDFDAVRLESVDVASGTMRFRLVQSLCEELESGVLLTADFRVEQKHVFTAVRFDVG
jgi:enterobactin synthetase component D